MMKKMKKWTGYKIHAIVSHEASRIVRSFIDKNTGAARLLGELKNEKQETCTPRG